ncbi:hypothetical protein [Candidatus Magnetaquiglobus chichijimensis]|uniref:hypothetical protein n=1 Tax=Candidatus Magnetaquiglobus chichijimensis TaxID=3141448 RepID=UPI003B976B81
MDFDGWFDFDVFLVRFAILDFDFDSDSVIHGFDFSALYQKTFFTFFVKNAARRLRLGNVSRLLRNVPEYMAKHTGRRGRFTHPAALTPRQA